MKTRFLLMCLSLCLAVAPRLQAQEETSPVRSQDELDQLFGPIALYPDALIALVLPASTMPSDIVMAARYLRSNGDPGRVDGESWDDSVKSLSHYPDVVKWMDENLAWTKQAGEAFAAQPADVMNAIQRLRTAARAAGTLVDTPQQRVVMEDDYIEIVPADPEIIYVPRYDPEVVYVSRPGYYHDPFLTFGVGFSTGIWLGCFDFDWGRHRLWTIDRRDRERYWREHLAHREWHGSPRVIPGTSHPRIVDDNRYRREDWKPRHDAHRPAYISGAVAHTDLNRPDSSRHPYHDQNPDRRSNDVDRKNDDHRPHRGPDGSNDGNRHPNTYNNQRPAPVSSTAAPLVPQRSEPARTPAVVSPPGVTPQSQSNPPRREGDHRDRSEREARVNDRSNSSHNPQGRVMQLQPPVQPKPQNTPTVVSREARAPQSPPQQQMRQHAPVANPPPVQARPQQAVVNSPRAPQPPPQASNSGNNDRKDRDDRRDRP